MNYARENEPGVTKYVITISQNVDDEQSIYVIEEYTLPFSMNEARGGAG